ncbi:MAG: hypothetical protein JWM02_1753 [Frankiales bacterium]|nr:hypothetical protein [Frankiales bacterium]
MTTVQATVRDWDRASGGSALLDDGSVVVLPPQCLRGSVFRFLRLGQRVCLTLQDGVVVAVDLP